MSLIEEPGDVAEKVHAVRVAVGTDAETGAGAMAV